MKLFTLKRNKIQQTTNKEVDGAEVWIVQWNTFDGSKYNNPVLVDTKVVAKAFLSYKDAVEFKKTLENALNLLQSPTIKIDATITKQK